jgi:hypothetical protein
MFNWGRRGAREEFFDISRVRFDGLTVTFGVRIRFIESHYLRLTCNIYIGRIMHSCTLGVVCRVACNRLCRYVSKDAGGFSRVYFPPVKTDLQIDSPVDDAASRRRRGKKRREDRRTDGRTDRQTNGRNGCKSALASEGKGEYTKVQ